MALPSLLLVSMGGRRSQRPGPSPTLGSLGPSHHRRHKSRVSLRGPPCAHGVSGIHLERCATHGAQMSECMILKAWSLTFPLCSEMYPYVVCLQCTLHKTTRIWCNFFCQCS